MKRRMITTMLLTVIIAGLCMGCGSSNNNEDREASAAEAESEYVYRVGYVNIDDSNNVCYPAAKNFKAFVESEEFAEAVGADKVEALMIDSASDIEKQTTGVETLLNKGVDMVFIVGVDTAGNTTAVEACNAENVPVFMVGTEASGGDWKFIGFDEKELGKYQGEWCVENLPENANICYLEGTPGREATVLRKEGFEEALSVRKDLNIISSQTGNFTSADAMQVTEDWIQVYGDEIDCIVSADGTMLVGTCEALKGANMLESVTTCGVIACDDEVYLIAEGTADYAVFVYWPSIGTLCGEVAQRAYQGEKIEERTNIDLHHITIDNYEELLAEYK